jgi:hypothetical protein
VTGRYERWRSLLRGYGAYYRHGARYNRIRQPTVYTTADPLVAISEQAFYSARDWQDRIGLSAPAIGSAGGVAYPLQSTQLFWVFSLDPGPTVVDLLDATAPATFDFRPYLLHDPVRETDPRANPAYSATRLVADRARGHASVPEGIRAPSVRTPPVGSFQPVQYVLDPFPSSKGLPSPLASRATLHACLLLTLEFLDTTAPAAAVSATSARVDWSHPRFRLDLVAFRGVAQPGPPGGTIPPQAGRPAGNSIGLQRWHALTIKFD